MKKVETVFTLQEWHVKYGKSPFQGEDTFFLENKQTRKIVEIADIISDLPYHNMQKLQVINALKFTYPRLAMLSDGSYKLYICGRLPGGGLMDDELIKLSTDLNIYTASNEELKKELLKRLDGTFDIVNVQMDNIRFPPDNEAKLAKIITVESSAVKYVQNLFSSKEEIMLNINRCILAILGSNDPQNKEHLIRASKRNCKISIAISMDRNHVSVNYDFDP